MTEADINMGLLGATYAFLAVAHFMAVFRAMCAKYPGWRVNFSIAALIGALWPIAAVFIYIAALISIHEMGNKK